MEKSSHSVVHRIAIFASGTGSNARKIIEYFKTHATIQVSLVVASKATAGVLDVAAEHGIPSLVLDRKQFYETEELLEDLRGIDLLVLAGFLWLIPNYLLRHFPRRIVNIHPALLPKYGGKGMYGKHVHQAVKNAGERESGITIHYVNEHYDEGRIIYQATCALSSDDDAQAIAQKVLALEHQHFAPVIEQLLTVNYRS